MQFLSHGKSTRWQCLLMVPFCLIRHYSLWVSFSSILWHCLLDFAVHIMLTFRKCTCFKLQQLTLNISELCGNGKFITLWHRKTTLGKLQADIITRRQSPSNPWFSTTLRAFRSTLRHAENIWKRTHFAADWSYFKSLRKKYHKLILSSKKEYYSSLVSSASDCHKMVLYIYFKFCTTLTLWFFWCMRIGEGLIFPVHGVVKGHDVLEKKNGI